MGETERNIATIILISSELLHRGCRSNGWKGKEQFILWTCSSARTLPWNIYEIKRVLP